MGKHDISSTLRKRAENTGSVTMPPSSQDDAADLAYEALFGGTLIPQQSKRTSKVPIEQLHPFRTANIGFKPYNDENLRALANDIAENGLLENIKIRPDQNGYEILSGHNRVNACKLLGWTEILADIEAVDDDRAIVIATVTNLQRRQGLLPSERGWAYRVLLEAQKHQGRRTDLIPSTCGQNDHKLKTRDSVAAFFGVDISRLRRDIRLTYLIEPLLEAVDMKRLNLLCGVEISYYDSATQKLFHERLCTDDWKLTVKMMTEIKKGCPPPCVKASTLGQTWNMVSVQHLRAKSNKPIVFDRKKFTPYLAKLDSEQDLETLFLEFLKTKFA